MLPLWSLLAVDSRGVLGSGLKSILRASMGPSRLVRGTSSVILCQFKSYSSVGQSCHGFRLLLISGKINTLLDSSSDLLPLLSATSTGNEINTGTGIHK